MKHTSVAGRVLSVVLSLVMVFTMIPVFSVGLMNKALAAAYKSADVVAGDLTFIVPEAIYLYPNGTSWTDTTSTPFQYYLNNDANNAPVAQKAKTGTIYYRYDAARDASLSWQFVDANFETLSAGSPSVTVSASTNLGTSKEIQITGGQSPSLAASVTGCWIQWCLSFTDSVDGQAKKAYAYTYVYKPYMVPVGGMMYTRNEDSVDHYNESIHWISGVHAVDTEEVNYHDGMFFMNYRGGSHSFSAFISDENVAYNGAARIESGGQGADVNGESSNGGGYVWRSGATRAYTVFQGVNNGTDPRLGTGDGSMDGGNSDYYLRAAKFGNRNAANANTFNVASFNYWYKNEQSSNKKEGTSRLDGGPRGVISIDTSRFSDLAQIPNLNAGLMLVNTSGGKYYTWHVSDFSGLDTLGTGYTQDDSSDNAYFSAGNYVIAGQATDGIRAGKAAYDHYRVQYAGAWPRTLLGDTAASSSAYTYRIKIYGCEEEDSSGTNAVAANLCLIELKANQYNKANLRAAVNNAVKAMPKLGVNGITLGAPSSVYFDGNDNFKWLALQRAYKKAVTALTKVDGTIEDPNTLASDLNAALAAVCTSVLFDGNGGTLTNAPVYQTVGLNQKITFTLPEASVSATKPGYSFAGWSTDPNAAVADAKAPGSTVTLGYNQTVYAIWQPNTYTVNFEGNGSTDGSTASQSLTYDASASLNPNGFSRAYAVNFDGNGGQPQTPSLTANYTFDGWEAADLISYSGIKQGTGYSDFASWTVAGPFAENDRFFLEFDALGTGTLNTYFYGNAGYLQVGNAVCSNGTTSTASDGNVSIPLTSSYQHYSIEYTLGANGNGNVDKIVLFRVFAGNSATVKGVRFCRLYDDQATVKNLTTSVSCTLKAHWAGGVITLPGATRNGYELNGWYDKASGSNRKLIGAAGDSYAVTESSVKKLYADWKISTYTITYQTPNLAGDTYTEETDTYQITSTKTLKKPAAPEGSVFGGWEVIANDGNWTFTTPITTQMSVRGMYGNVTLRAKWDPKPYNFSITCGTGASYDNAPASVAHGQTYTFAVTLADGYDAAAPEVTATNAAVSVTGSGKNYAVTITDVTGDVGVTITPTPNSYTLTINSYTGSDGYTTNDNLKTISHNGNVTFILTLSEGYTDVEPTVMWGDTALSPVSGPDANNAYTYEILNVTRDITLDVTAHINTYAVDFTADEGAALDQASPVTVNFGSNLDFTVTLQPGFTQNPPQVTVDGAAVSPQSVSENVYAYTIENVRADKSVSVTTTPNVYTLTADPTADATISFTAESVGHNGESTVTVSLREGRSLQGATANGTAITLTQQANGVYAYTFTGITEDIRFAVQTYVTTYPVTVETDGGAVAEPASAQVAYGDTHAFTVTLNPGFTKTAPVAKIGDQVLTATLLENGGYGYTLPDVRQAVTVNVTTTPNVYDIVVTTATGAASTPVSGRTSHNGSFAFTVATTYGYDATAPTVTAGDAVLTPVSGPDENHVYGYELTGVTADTEIIVTPIPNTYTVNLTADAGIILPETQTARPYLDTYTFTVTPEIGYNSAAIRATANGAALAPSPNDDGTVTFRTVITEDTEIHVTTSKQYFFIRFEDYDGELLSQQYLAYGDTPSFGATPTRYRDQDAHYTFAGWDHEIEPVTEAAVYTATYTAYEHELVLASDQPSYSCTEGGKKIYVCRVCGIRKVENLAPVGEHVWSDWFIVEPATADSHGLERRRCSVCSAIQERSTEKLADNTVPTSIAKKRSFFDWFRELFARIRAFFSSFSAFRG